MGRRRGHILDGMTDSFRNKHFIARLGDDLFPADRQPELPDHDGHELIRRMDEIIPLTVWRVSEHIAGVAALVPVASDLVAVERHREFLVGEMGHIGKS